MKLCPQCGREFPDKYRFCQHDRTPLLPAPAPPDAKTGFTTPSPALPVGRADSAVAPDTRARMFLPLAVVAAAALLGLAAVSYLHLKQKDGAQAAALTASTVTPAAPAAPAASNASPSQQARTVAPSARDEIIATLEAWAAASRAHDLDTHMSYYADTLDSYYNQKGVSVLSVRANRERAYNKYSKLDIQLANIVVEVSPSGERAQATFDKTFTFEGTKPASGSVRQLIELVFTGGRWRITGEKDLEVYYANW